MEGTDKESNTMDDKKLAVSEFTLQEVPKIDESDIHNSVKLSQAASHALKGQEASSDSFPSLNFSHF